MPKRAKGLTKTFVARVREPGRYSDGNGLHLFVTKRGTKSWVQRLTIGGVRRDMGLGSLHDLDLAAARDLAIDNKRHIRGPRVPKAIAELTGAAAPTPAAVRHTSTAPTVAEALGAVLALHAPTWKASGSTEKQWRGQFDKYVLPRLGTRPVDTVTVADCMGVLAPIWSKVPSVAKMVRQRLAMVFDWAIAQGHRPDNPCNGAVSAALPKSKTTVTHQMALPHAEVGEALGEVAKTRASASLKNAIRFQVLTAARKGEVRRATWNQLDVDGRLWTLPADSMKAGKEHRVPLSAQAMAVLMEQHAATGGAGLVFPSPTGKAFADNSARMVLKRAGVDAVPHGFRSSFRDWCAEVADAPRELAEAALAHSVGNQVEAAYNRTDLLARRRELMQAWADYVAHDETTV